MKILLIMPAAQSLRVKSKSERVPERRMLRFSILPLLTVAGLTPEVHEVAICDENVEPVNLDSDADIVGISFMTAYAPRAYELSAEFRRRGAKTVAGGYHPTLMPYEAARHFDAVVVGDAEGLWQRLVDDASKGELKGMYRHSSQPEFGYSLPRRDLMKPNAKQYATINAIQAGRGCSNSCRYCSVAAFHRGSCRHRSVASVMDELSSIKGSFIFVDDNIIADRGFAKELFTAMRGSRQRWVSQCSIDIADDPELLDLAYYAGCRGLFIGLETASECNLKAVGKEFNKASSYKDRVGRIRSGGIGVVAGVIVGMDGDAMDVFDRTLRMLETLEVDAVQVNIMTPLPGTPLFNDFWKAGRITSFDWGRYDFRHVVFRPARMGASELQDGADWLYAQFYRLDRILMRFAKSAFTLGIATAILGLKLGLTYRYDNIREGMKGMNPSRKSSRHTMREHALADG